MEQLAEQWGQILEQVGVEAFRVWPQIVQVTWFIGLFWVIVDPLVLCLGVVLLRRCWYWRSRLDHSEYEHDDESVLVTVMFIGGAVVFVFVGLAMLTAYPTFVADMLYPEARTVLRLFGK